VYVLKPDLLTAQKGCIIDDRNGSDPTSWGMPMAPTGEGSSDDATSSSGGLYWSHLHLQHIYNKHAMPAKRLVSFHAHLAIQRAEKLGWIAAGDVEVPKQGWASPGAGDWHMLQRFLSDSSELAGELARRRSLA
jgi:hypothetical protein